MSVLDSVRIVIYRVNAKGLEIFLTNNTMDKDPEVWGIPRYCLSGQYDNMIWLDNTFDAAGNQIQSVAIEGDWHDIPSIRGIIKHDMKLVQSKLKSLLPGQDEKGSYINIKEAFKKVLPEEYKVLKELKDIVLDRNMTNNI